MRKIVREPRDSTRARLRGRQDSASHMRGVQQRLLRRLYLEASRGDASARETVQMFAVLQELHAKVTTE